MAPSDEWLRVKAGVVCLQCESCVIHIWALQWWVPYHGALYKICLSFTAVAVVVVCVSLHYYGGRWAKVKAHLATQVGSIRLAEGNYIRRRGKWIMKRSIKYLFRIIATAVLVNDIAARKKYTAWHAIVIMIACMVISSWFKGTQLLTEAERKSLFTIQW